MTAIVFEALTASPDTQVDAIATLPPLQGFATEAAGNHAIGELPALTGSATGVAAIILARAIAALPALEGRAFQTPGNHGAGALPALVGEAVEASEPLPATGDMLGTLPALAGGGRVFVRCMAALVAELPALGGIALEAAGTAAIGALPALQGVAVESAAAPANRALLVQPPGFLSSLASTAYVVTLNDGVDAHAGLSGQPGIGLSDRFNVHAALAGAGHFQQLLADNARLRDAAVLAWDLLLADGVSFGADVAVVQAMMVAIGDRLLLTGAVATQLEGFAALVAGATMAARVGTGYEAHLDDGVDFGAALVATASMLAELLDNVTLSDGVAGFARITALLDDRIALDDEALSQLTTTQVLLDGLTVGASIRIGDEEYFAWVLHPQPIDKAGTRPVTQYRAWPFNSHAGYAGKFYGAGPGGFFELVGADDAGTGIDAWVRGGLSDLGTSRRKRLPEALLAIDGADRAVYLKIRHVDPVTGTLIEDWYDLEPETKAPGVTREQRGKFQRGIKATWWGYELRNRNGAPFKAANLRFYPLILSGSS